MKRSFYAKLLLAGAILMQIQGVSCLGVPVGEAPVYQGQSVLDAIRAFLANFGIQL